MRKELERQERIVPQSNKLSYSDQGMFLITGLLLKRVKDNRELVDSILEKHFASK